MSRAADALLRRLAASPQAGAFVLRGGLLTRHWAGPARRATRDLDFLGLFPRSLDEAHDRMAEWLAVTMGDGEEVALDTLRGGPIWQETDFPGLRFFVEACGEETQVDIGFGDPLDPPAAWLDYPLEDGGTARVLAVTPELQAAWKLDGLFEHGLGRWLAKDLFDLWLLTACCPLDAATLRRASQVAFAAHGHDLGDTLRRLQDASFWAAPEAAARWARFRAAAGVPVPEFAGALAAETSSRLDVLR